MEWSRKDCCRQVGNTRQEDLNICLDLATYHSMWGQACASAYHEIGGVMLGQYLPEDHVLIIDAALPAESGRSARSAFTFTATAWESIHQLQEDRHSGRKIVGWYHTHPSLGIFLSSYDEYICHHFFNLPWQVALVMDPLSETLGFFQWKRGQLDLLPGISISSTKAKYQLPAALVKSFPADISKDTATADEGAAPPIRYTVTRGDTLELISLRLYGDGRQARRIGEYNSLDPYAVICPGQVLLVPVTEAHMGGG